MLLKRSLAVIAAQATPAVDQGAPDYYESGVAKTPVHGLEHLLRPGRAQ
ncbi:hypothetical protein [Amycolatopsis sp. cmx-8-4]